MPDKISDYSRITSLNGNDLFILSRKSGNTYVTRNISANNLFSNVAGNTSIHGIFTQYSNAHFRGSNTFFTSNVNVTAQATLSKLKVANTKIVFGGKLTPANSTTTMPQFTWFFDNSYIYVTTANNVIKRVALSSF